MNVVNRLTSFGRSRRGGTLVLLLGILATVIWVQVQAGAFTGYGGVGNNNQQWSVHPRTGVQLRASLSQPMIVQGSDGTVYLDLSVMTPALSRPNALRMPTDVVIILDLTCPHERVHPLS